MTENSNSDESSSFLAAIKEKILPKRYDQIGSNLFWLVGNRLFRMLAGVIVLGYVGRYLGRAQFGELNYAINFAVIFAAIASLGAEGIVIRELVRFPEKTPIILGTAFVLRLVGGTIAFGAVYLAGLAGRAKDSLFPLMIVVGLAFWPQAFEVIDLWFQKNIQAKFTVVARGLAVLLGSGVKIGLVLAKAPLLWFAWSMVLDATLNASALIWVFNLRQQSLRDWRFDFSVARLIVRDSWPLILSGLLVSVYMRVEQFLVMNFLGSQSMGIYYSAVRINEMWAFIPVIILSTLYPILVEKRHQDAAGYKRQLQKVFDGLTGLGYLVAVGITLMAGHLIPWIYGAEFKDGVTVLMIQAWTAPLTFNSSVRAQYFLIENITIYHTWSALLGIVSNVTLAVLLMPRLGVAGAAIAALAGYWFSGYLTSFLFRQLRECGQMQTKALLLMFRLPTLIRNLRGAR